MKTRNSKSKKAAVSAILVLSLLSSTASQPCRAQQGGDIAKGLLRALIESQLEKSRRRNAPPAAQLGPRPTTTTAQMQQLRPIAASFEQEATTLGALLNTDSRRSVDARRRRPDVLRLQAEASALKQRLASNGNHNLFIDDFRSLNNDWSILAHQLQQDRKLSAQTNACIQRIGALDTQYCSILGIQAQYSSQDLTRAAYTMTTYVRDLVDDVRHAPHNHAHSNHTLLQDMARFSHKTEYFAGLAARGAGFNTIVGEYKTLYQAWLKLEEQLAGYSGHNIARDMRRIRDAHQTIHQQLRLEIGIDKNLVLHLIHEADHELSALLRTITLDDLLTLPEADSVPQAADEVSGNIQNIDDLVHRDQDTQSVAEAWAYTSTAWSQFEYLLRPIQNVSAQAQIRDIGEAIESIRHALGVTIAYDPRTITQSASTLEVLSERLLSTLQRWQQRPGQHDRSLVNKARQLVNLFHHIEQSVLQGRRGQHNLHECDEAIVYWQQIRPVIKTCDTPERETFDHIAATFTAEVVRLRTMLDE